MYIDYVCLVHGEDGAAAVVDFDVLTAAGLRALMLIEKKQPFS